MPLHGWLRLGGFVVPGNCALLCFFGARNIADLLCPFKMVALEPYDAPILPYTEVNDIDVHFFPDGTAKIVVLSSENKDKSGIPKPVRPAGWDYPDANEEYW